MIEDLSILIPARLGSKGVKFKNRLLLDYTLDSIPSIYRERVFVSTDDPVLHKRCRDKNISFFNRPKDLSSDTASMKAVLLHAKNLIKSKYIMVLYLTYPERSWQDIEDFLFFFEDNKAKSALCRKEIKSSPFLMMYQEHGFKGRQIINHNLYRRQDYPKCFEISHFISAFDRSEIENLNNNLYNKDTIFFEIQNKIDIDTNLDLREFYEK